MKKLLLVVLLLVAPSVKAQVSFPVVQGSISASSSNCSVAYSCVWQAQLSANAGTSTINISGAFSATLLVEESNNSGQTWSTFSTLTAAGTTTYNVNGFTDIRVRGSAYTSGSASITINTGLLQVQSITSGGGGVGAGAAPVMGFYAGNNCPAVNMGQCFNVFADRQESNLCQWGTGLSNVTCYTQVAQIVAAVASNVATYTFPGITPLPNGWVVGNSITVVGFTGGDTFFNQTCTLTAVTSSSVSCALTHANASSTTFGDVINTSVGPFTPADVGKRIEGYQTGTASSNLAQGTNNNPLASTQLSISGYTSSLTVVISSPATNTVPASGNFPQGGYVTWGHPDDAGMAAMDAAMQLVNYCPKWDIASGNYWLNNPYLFTNPRPCRELPTQIGASFTAGNIVYSGGFEGTARGSGTTNIFIPHDFPENIPCNNGLSKKGCFVIPTQGRWSNIHITGGGNRAATGMVLGHILLEMDGPASLENFNCTNFGGSDASGNPLDYGIGAFLWVQLTHVNLSACGSSQLATNTSSSLTAIRLWIENLGSYRGMDLGILTDYFTQAPSAFTKYNLICYDCTVNREGILGSTAPVGVVNNAGLKIKWYRGGIAPQGGPAQNGYIGYECITTAGCVLDAEDAFFDLSPGSLGTGYTPIDCTVACTNYLKNSVIKGTTGGSAYVDVTGSQMNDMGGNTWGAISSVLGTWVGPTNSARGTACATGNFALTSGWGTSSIASVAANGDIQGCHVTITGAAGAASPVLTWTYPQAPPLAPGSCHLSGVSGTLTGVSAGTPGATTIAFTFTGTPSVQTYNFDTGCP